MKLFADNFVKEAIIKISSGKKIDDIFEKGEAKVSCSVCNKCFAKRNTLDIHMKSHIICNQCEKGFKKDHELARHKSLVHTKQIDQLNVENTNQCENCSYVASSRKSLMVHKEEKHIGDSWLVNTKRDESMMYPEGSGEKTKTKEPEQKKKKANKL